MYSNKTKDIATPKIPRGLRVLPASAAGMDNTNPRTELQNLKEEAATIERWFADPRWKHTKRIYSGTQEKKTH